MAKVDTDKHCSLFLSLQSGAITMGCIGTLTEMGLRLTPQRGPIMDVLHDNKAHLTPDEIIAHVQSRMPGVNKSTVYRTL